MGKAKAKAKAEASGTKPKGNGKRGGVKKLSVKQKKEVQDKSGILAGRAQRRLFRRTSDEAAGRAIKLIFGMFPAQQLENNKDGDGKYLFANVKAEQFRVKCANNISAWLFGKI